jgi:hypothetical protein
MAKPLTEHKTRVKAKRGQRFEPVASDGMQPVEGGRVRRIVFEGEPEFQEVRHDEKHYVPRHHAPIEDIEFEVDNIHRLRRGETPLTPRQLRAESKRVYSTERGEVRAAYQPTSYGQKRVLYTSNERGQEKRFSEAEVDRLIAGVDLQPRVEVHREVKTRFITRRKKVVEKVPVAGAKPKKVKRAKKEKKAKKNKRAVEQDFEEVHDYQPQCEAVTADGMQCRNSARGGSKYCGAHKGYRARTFEEVLAAKDTAPAHAVAEDTAPGETGSDESTHQAQCAAYTKEGGQCKNSSRRGSKYCGSHKGYRAPSKAQLLSQMDTKPRWAKAKDTPPNLK